MVILPTLAMAAPILGDPCPNGDIRKTQDTAFLPGCMALEQVSPQLKNSQPARIHFVNPVFGGSSIGGISPDGGRVSFISAAALAGTPGLQDVSGDWYVAARVAGQSGWVTDYTSPPVGFTRGWTAVPYPRSFNADLSQWFQVASSRKQYEAGLGQAFRGGLGGTSLAMSPLLTPLSGHSGGFVQFAPRGSSADSSRLYLVADSTITYLPGDPTPNGSGAERNVYIALLDPLGKPSLQLVARDGDGKVWGGNCGVGIGGNPSSARNLGAISSDGSRTYFTTRPDQPVAGPCDSAANKERIMVREDTSAGVEIRELFPSPPGVGDDLYQGASIEGTRVYFSTDRQLVASDLDATTDLYLFDAGQPIGDQLTDLSGLGTATPNVGAISGDGSHVYFNSTDVLTVAPGPGGHVAQVGQPNLYLYEQSPAHPDGRLAFIAATIAGSSYPVPVLGPDPDVLGVGGDGHRLLFTSNAALTADDEDGAHADVFRYDAEDETLVRISKAAPDGVDNGPFSVMTGAQLGAIGDDNSPDFVGRGRWVSEDGETVVFKTRDGLVPDDNNGILDSYLWREGNLARLPGTEDETNGLVSGKGLQDKPLVSLDGDTVAFQTFEKLLPRDGDSAIDVYAARVGGGFPEPLETLACLPDGNQGCQGSTGAPPDGSSPPSTTLVGRGNLAERPPVKPCPKGKRRVRRNGKARCVRKKRSSQHRNANTDRRAGR